MSSPISAQRILIVQLRQVGDVLLTTPALKALRDFYPKAQIDYLTEPGPAGILQNNPHLNTVIIRKRKATLREDLALIGNLRRQHYDLILDFMSNPRSAILTRLAGAPCRVARNRFGRNFYYTHTPRVESNHLAYSPTHKLALLEAVGIPAPLSPPVIRVPEEAQRKIQDFQQAVGLEPTALRVTMDATSRLPHKKWPGERFVEVADWLKEQHNCQVIFIWGPGEREEVQALIASARHPHILACPTNLMELAALIEQSHLHIGNCSGPRHIAVAVGTPSMTVMGPTFPANWTYPSPAHRAVQGEASCPDCQAGTCILHRDIRLVSVEDVQKALDGMFRDGVIG